jgi:hypothetical protein
MNSKTELKLQKELDRLKNLSKLGSKLRVAWAPSSNGPLSAEVRNNVIHIYESDESKAVDVLQHEFVDSVVSSVLEPYKEVVNELIRLLNKNAYRQKEDVVEGLKRLIFNTIEDEQPSPAHARNLEEVLTS